MAKPTDTLPKGDTQTGDALQEVSEKRLLELLDEIYELEQFRREQLILRRLRSYLMSALTRDEAYAAVERFGPQLWPGAQRHSTIYEIDFDYPAECQAIQR